ncbi:asparagine synthase (glutamine-hydrolyzing) [Luteolibacter sp. AS25]|uniref:asparagine synthase (glutamine-hydrolyzing) n=1 Tax=Luteolibacter sp. AS25 TaxID=3135776 RepID=UPI00398B2626
MCGIAGGLQLSPDRLEDMLRVLHHRGPDGSGKHFGANFSLGMTRLAILDSKNGKQPFSSPDQRIHAICNGEIYNWQELRQQLQDLGHQFHTRCDAEIIPAGYLEWGTDLPTKLNGMFAIAIHDAENDTLFLARDRCGQKPLYLTTSDSAPLRFASEIKALAAGSVLLIPDPTQLATWLSLRYLPEPATLYQNIQTLPAAHWTLIQKNGSRLTQRYWQPDTSSSPRSGDLDTLDQLTRSSVELALQSDVPVAAYLSGGVDSALLAHYLHDLGADISTVSLGFGSSSDETPAAQATADHLNLPHHPLQLKPESLQDLPRVVSQMDLPVGDTLILAFDHLAAHTTSLGAKVALGGEGPDEHFAGYSFQKAFLTAQKLGPFGRPLAATALQHLPQPLLNRLANFPATLGPEGRHKITDYLRQFGTLTSHQKATNLHTLFTPPEISSLLHPDLLASQATPPYTPEITNLNLLLAPQYTSWLPDWSLIRQDRNTMAHSLEYRAPFLDHRIIDFAFTLPDSQKVTLRHDKYLWRKLAARHLPKTITQRPKQPFYLPLEHPSWRIPFLEMARDILSPQTLANHPYFDPKSINPLFKSTTFLPLKQLAAIVILQLWL